MTFTETITGAFARPAAVGAPDADTRLLGAALTHLLNREDERPARWLSAAFGPAVEVRRAELRDIVALADLPVRDLSDEALSFESAAARLARHPGDVALAVRSLEISGSRHLPVWAELLRRGLPPRRDEPDPALWFG